MHCHARRPDVSCNGPAPERNLDRPTVATLPRERGEGGDGEEEPEGELHLSNDRSAFALGDRIPKEATPREKETRPASHAPSPLVRGEGSRAACSCRAHEKHDSHTDVKRVRRG